MKGSQPVPGRLFLAALQRTYHSRLGDVADDEQAGR